jgi:hypothetical protein
MHVMGLLAKRRLRKEHLTDLSQFETYAQNQTEKHYER